MVCSDDTCFDPAVIDNEEVPDLKVAASARLPDDNLRLIFEQMAQRNQENADDKVRLLLEAAKVTDDSAVLDNDVAEPVDELNAETLDEEDKTSVVSVTPSPLLRPAAERPKLVINRPPGS